MVRVKPTSLEPFLAETMRFERLLHKTSKSNKLIKGGLKVIISRSAAFASKILVGRHLTFVMDFLLREHRLAFKLQDLKITNPVPETGTYFSLAHLGSKFVKTGR